MLAAEVLLDEERINGNVRNVDALSHLCQIVTASHVAIFFKHFNDYRSRFSARQICQVNRSFSMTDPFAASPVTTLSAFREFTSLSPLRSNPTRMQPVVSFTEFPT